MVKVVMKEITTIFFGENKTNIQKILVKNLNF